MGYEINSPVKTVYLPLDGKSHTNTEFKKLTGIDLQDIFFVDTEHSTIRVKPFTNLVLYCNESVGSIFYDYNIYKGDILPYVEERGESMSLRLFLTSVTTGSGVAVNLVIFFAVSQDDGQIGFEISEL